MKVKKDYKFKISISDEGYEDKTISSAMIASVKRDPKIKDIRSSYGYNPNRGAGFLEEELTSQELYDKLLAGHMFCHLFNPQQLRKDGTFGVYEKTNSNFKGTYVIPVDIDDTDYTNPHRFANMLSMKPTLYYTTYSNMQPGKGMRLRLIYVLEDMITNRYFLRYCTTKINDMIASSINKDGKEHVCLDSCNLSCSQYFNGTNKNCGIPVESGITNYVYNVDDLEITDKDWKKFLDDGAKYSAPTAETSIQIKHLLNKSSIIEDIGCRDNSPCYKSYLILEEPMPEFQDDSEKEFKRDCLVSEPGSTSVPSVSQPELEVSQVSRLDPRVFPFSDFNSGSSISNSNSFLNKDFNSNLDFKSDFSFFDFSVGIPPTQTSPLPPTTLIDVLHKEGKDGYIVDSQDINTNINFYLILKDWDSCTLDEFEKKPMWIKAKCKYKYFRRVEKEWIDDRYQFVDDDYFELFHISRKLYDGSKRKRCIYERMCLRRIMRPDITIPELMFNAIVDIMRYCDNSDRDLNSDYIKRNIKDAFSASIEELEKRYKNTIDYLKKATRPVRGIIYNGRHSHSRETTFRILDDWYNKELTIEENIEMIYEMYEFRISRRHIYNYLKARDLKPKNDKFTDEELLPLIDTSMTIMKNLEIYKDNGISIGKNRVNKLLNIKKDIEREQYNTAEEPWEDYGVTYDDVMEMPMDVAMERYGLRITTEGIWIGNELVPFEYDERWKDRIKTNMVYRIRYEEDIGDDDS